MRVLPAYRVPLSTAYQVHLYQCNLAGQTSGGNQWWHKMEVGSNQWWWHMVELGSWAHSIIFKKLTKHRDNLVLYLEYCCLIKRYRLLVRFRVTHISFDFSSTRRLHQWFVLTCSSTKSETGRLLLTKIVTSSIIESSVQQCQSPTLDYWLPGAASQNWQFHQVVFET